MSDKPRSAAMQMWYAVVRHSGEEPSVMVIRPVHFGESCDVVAAEAIRNQIAVEDLEVGDVFVADLTTSLDPIFEAGRRLERQARPLYVSRLDGSLKGAMAERVGDALRLACGNKKQTAMILGVSRRALYRLLEKLGVGEIRRRRPKRKRKARSKHEVATVAPEPQR